MQLGGMLPWAGNAPTQALRRGCRALAMALPICAMWTGAHGAKAHQLGMQRLAAATKAAPAKVAPAKVASPAPPPAPIKELPPPYEAQLLDLSQTVGILSYLRGLCMDGDEKQWREHMAAIIDSDAQSPERRKQLIAAFNTGYGSYALSYHNCTANAKQIIARELARADRLGREISSHYGGK